MWAAANGITYGTDARHFSPDKRASRGEMVSFLYRAYLYSAGDDITAGKECPFKDVSPSAYYFDAVVWAFANGITYGTDAGHFSPDMFTDRAQVVSFLHRFCTSPAIPEWYLDGKSISEFGKTAVR